MLKYLYVLAWLTFKIYFTLHAKVSLRLSLVSIHTNWMFNRKLLSGTNRSTILELEVQRDKYYCF